MSLTLYQPLPSTGLWTRLLTIHGGEDSAPLKCTLLPCQLPETVQSQHINKFSKSADPASAISYEALSYMWGETTLQRGIEINDQVVPINENLWQFLHAIRHPLQEDRIVWCDALCISQSDIEEKNRQVEFIGVIFGHAESVNVWLGPEDADISSLFTLMKRLTEATDLFSIKRFKKAIETDGEFLRYANYGRGLLAILGRKYWQRTWVQQEIVIGRNVVLNSGKHCIPWKTFQRFCDELATSEDSPKELARAEYENHLRQAVRSGSFHCLSLLRFRVQSILSGSGTLQGSQAFQPREVFEVASDTECCDPRDKVYALKTLLNLGIDRQFKDLPPIQVDHSINLASLYFQILPWLREKGISSSSPADGDRVRRMFGLSWEEVSRATEKTSEQWVGLPHTMHVRGVLVGEIEDVATVPGPFKYRVRGWKNRTPKDKSLSDYRFVVASCEMKHGDRLYHFSGTRCGLIISRKLGYPRDTFCFDGAIFNEGADVSDAERSRIMAKVFAAFGASGLSAERAWDDEWEVRMFGVWAADWAEICSYLIEASNDADAKDYRDREPVLTKSGRVEPYPIYWTE